MSMSLREQLLAAGLGTKKQAKQADHQQRQQAKNKAADEERKRAQQQAQAAKAARDAELNRQRQLAAEAKARIAAIKQLIEQHQIPKPEDTEEYYNFIHKDKVRRMPVNAELRPKIANGQINIVRCEGKYYLVPQEIGERIRERDGRAVVKIDHGGENSVDENDPYKDFVVPDDLKW